MKTYTLFDPPLRVDGIPNFYKEKRLARLSEALMAELPHLERLGRKCGGARVSFKTDSPVFHIQVKLKTIHLDRGLSMYAAQSVQIMLGERLNARYLGLACAPNYETKTFEKTFKKSSALEQVTVYLPRGEEIESIEISVEEDAVMAEPTPFRYERPVVFYGSSITSGGCASNTTNTYQAILSRWLDFDYYNLGLSANAKGELAVADYINTLDMCAFVYDYDHNAPTVQHLADTHKPFFDRIREVHPNLPILMMTRPAEIYTEGMKERREVVKATYQAAMDAGDRNVYFLDGETFYGETDRNLCSLDGCHPNDLGFYRMACAIRPVLKSILEKS